MPVEFLLVGSGWRAEFFIRLAGKLPECFAISAVVTYLTFLLEEAVKTGKEITAKEQLWTHLLYEN